MARFFIPLTAKACGFSRSPFDKQEGWDANVTFLSQGKQYTVDLLINQDDGQITNARLIDTMTPL